MTEMQRKVYWLEKLRVEKERAYKKEMKEKKAARKAARKGK